MVYASIFSLLWLVSDRSNFGKRIPFNLHFPQFCPLACSVAWGGASYQPEPMVKAVLAICQTGSNEIGRRWSQRYYTPEDLPPWPLARLRLSEYPEPSFKGYTPLKTGTVIIQFKMEIRVVYLI